jgi:hypothetical protein
MARKPMNLADDVGDAVAAIKPKTWLSQLDAAAREELLAVRDRFHAGGYAARRGTIARVLVNACRQRGWAVCDHKRLAEWLANTSD